MEHIAPPGIDIPPVRIEIPEGIREAGIQKRGHLFPLLGGEAGVLRVAFRVLQVDLLMGDIHVPADDDRLFPVQIQQIAPEGVLPGHAVIQTGQAALAVGGIDRDKIKGGILQGDDAALVIMLREADAVADGEGLPLREDCGAAVALFLGGIHVQQIALRGNIRLTGLHFGLLQAEEIRVRGAEIIHEALAHAGAQTVDIPGNKSRHFRTS